MVVKSQYLCSMQVDTNLYWNKHPQQHVTTFPKNKILHPQLKVISVTDSHEIPKNVCNRKQAKKSISRQPICLNYSDYNYILEEIGRQENRV